MKCISCGAVTYPSMTVDVTDTGNCLIIIRNVPCNKCSECDETIYNASVVKQLEFITTAAKSAVNDIAILDYTSKVA
jgi:YgiT-type zinc finger domain-containing protein